MNAYFIKTDKKQYGPLTLEMLKSLSIHRDTMLWRKGMNEWQKAEEFPELQSIFTDVPPNLDGTSFHRHSYIKKKILLFRLAKCVKPALIASVILTILTAVVLWLTFKPNKFGEAEVERINQYFREQQLKFQAQQMADEAEMRKWKEYERQHPEVEQERKRLTEGINNPFKDVGVVPIGPGASIPYEYVDGFWDYCKNADGEVFLNLTDIKSSFDSRSSYLTKKIVKICVFSFLIFFATILAFLYYKHGLVNRKVS
ncbi:MAG: DUF4339 domain-containing protein [Terrimonas sp.]|nr:DUF4339 domain-containing protein [Terrimonas sp.]